MNGSIMGKEISLDPGSPLVLTHRIKLVPSGSGLCGCEADFAALRERLERLEREVSDLREKCGGAGGSCCTSESKGAGCSIKSDTEDCPNECSDQGRCVDGKCVCFAGYSGTDCSQSNCPGNCNNNGRCVNGECVCDPGFSGLDCSQRVCPNNCNNQGRCLNGKCVCDSGFTGPSCSEESCPGNCNRRGSCVDGRCVCSPGFTGSDCSKKACPDNCNNRGRCLNGKCVCSSGFTGADCSGIACPRNCNNKGRCINGQCVCNDGFTGADCSERACPNNCNNHGRCVNGQCACDDGFTGADCSAKACPNNCNNHGRCMNGKCVCTVGFAGPDCAFRGCPNNCNNKGRCFRGKCVCRTGFTGPDCSQCQEGKTGPNCNTAMAGVSQLSARNITESSVTLVWTPPPVQYETYYITFTSQKEKDQRISSQVNGSQSTFTQTGLAASQEYDVKIYGELQGRKGAESATEFMTLISRPTNLQVVKTTSNSAVVQWEPSQGEVDRYRLTILPDDGAGRSRELSIPAGQTSAHIRQLEAGRLYNILLVAEKGLVQSHPVNTQVVPGNTLSRAHTEDLTMQVTQAPGRNADSKDQEFNSSPGVQEVDQQGGRSHDFVDVGASSASINARTKSLVGKMVARNGTRPRVVGRPLLSKPKIPGSFRFNASRIMPGGRISVPGSVHKNPKVAEKEEETEIKSLQPYVLTIRDSGKDQSEEASTSEKIDDISPTVMPGSDSETNKQRGSEEPSSAIGSKRQPDVGIALPGNDTNLVSLNTTGTIQGQEKKCLNKIKVTHFRLPLKDRVNRYRGDGKGLEGNTTGSDPNETPPHVMREPLNFVGVTNRTSHGYTLLTPGSSYEVTIISTLGLDESDPIKDFVMTLPDPPTDLQAMNVTDSTALLLWRPALAAVDKYAIVYGSGTGTHHSYSELRITVSGNAAEHQLHGLEESTTYTITISSQLGSLESSPATTSFTTSSTSARDSDEAKDLQAKNVTPRTALVSWTPPSRPADGYILIYQTKDEKPKEVLVGPNETQFKLTRLYPGSLYKVNLRTLRGVQLMADTFTTFTTGRLRFPFPTDCSQELLNGILTSEVVEIFPEGKLGKPMMVYCDMETDGGGWTVFQRRKDGSVDFYRGFEDYVKGFGNLSGEFWLGLEKLHNLTTMTRMNLRVDLRDGGQRVFAQYSTFVVAKRHYRLTVGGYSGTAGDSLSFHNNRIFSTKDRDPTPGIIRCAISYQGGWWYNNCHESNLNGLYGIDFKHQGVIWKSWKGEDHSIQFTEMKMRPANFRSPSRGSK
ncbi:tenascin [Nematolebias whitei]|uniref:tenascin n=1 Tax=Nematolebias whitei TaxID=451745 RepID=UPI001897BB44|nr:tenascin [Nematolebias whitei]